MTAGPAATQVTRKAVALLDATALAVGRTEGRGARARATGATGTGTNSSSSSTDESRRAPVLEITDITSKWQVVPSLTDVAFSAAPLDRLTMPDDRAMPVSSSLVHARTSAIDSAAATAATKHTAEVKTGVQNTSVSKISLAIQSFLSPPRSTLRTPSNNSLVRSRPSRLMCNDGSHESLSSPS